MSIYRDTLSHEVPLLGPVHNYALRMMHLLYNKPHSLTPEQEIALESVWDDGKLLTDPSLVVRGAPAADAPTKRVGNTPNAASIYREYEKEFTTDTYDRVLEFNKRDLQGEYGRHLEEWVDRHIQRFGRLRWDMFLIVCSILTNSNFACVDGEPLISDVAGDRPFDNYITGLSGTAVADVRGHISTLEDTMYAFENDKGEQIGAIPDTLIVSDDLYDTVFRACRPGNNEPAERAERYKDRIARSPTLASGTILATITQGPPDKKPLRRLRGSLPVVNVDDSKYAATGQVSMIPVTEDAIIPWDPSAIIMGVVS